MPYPGPLHPRPFARRISQHIQTRRWQTGQPLFPHMSARGRIIRAPSHGRDARVPAVAHGARDARRVPERFAAFRSRDIDALEVAHEAAGGGAGEEGAEEGEACADNANA